MNTTQSKPSGVQKAYSTYWWRRLRRYNTKARFFCFRTSWRNETGINIDLTPRVLISKSTVGTWPMALWSQVTESACSSGMFILLTHQTQHHWYGARLCQLLCRVIRRWVRDVFFLLMRAGGTLTGRRGDAFFAWASGASWNCYSAKEIHTETRYVSLNFIILVKFQILRSTRISNTFLHNS